MACLLRRMTLHIQCLAFKTEVAQVLLVVGDMSLSSSSHAISIAIMAWNGEHRAFVIENYFKNGDYHCNATELW